MIRKHPYQILILRIGCGKIVDNKNMFGRSMRHNHFPKYLYGALEIYLLSRFMKIE